MRSRLFWKRAPLTLLLALAVACTGLPFPVPRLVFDTPTPIPMGPTPTPLASNIVTFNVRVPANTPAGSAPGVQIIDEVGGTRLVVPLVNTGGVNWSGGTLAPAGAVLRYKYVRTLPAFQEEVNAARQPVPFRLLLAGAGNTTADDAVAAWTDTPFAGDTGAIVGTVRNSNTNNGVMGVMVEAGGKTTLTAWDGTYALHDLPVGAQRVTILAPDGALRPAQNVVTVAKGQAAALDLSSPDPNLVHVTFIVRPPPNTEPVAPVRLAGNVSQMGDTFTLDANGSAIAAARLPTLIKLADGRWGTQVALYEGTVLNYKYTLGDGAWNGELDSAGNRRLRQIIIPASDMTIEDSIDAWHVGISSSVIFEAAAPVNTPPNDVLTIQFRTGSAWLPPLPMWRTGLNAWKFVLYNPTDAQGNVFYRYCRNYACGAADDAATASSAATGRFFTPTLLEQDLKDTVSGWQWPPDAVPPAGAIPAALPHPGFGAGVDFDDKWNHNWIPSYGETFRNLQALGANWVTFTPLVSAQMAPAPAFSYDLALAPLLTDWKPLVDQAHNAGLRFALHPVTCRYLPYGPCEYWLSAALTPEFWNAWFAAYEKHIVTQAELAARNNMDLLVVGDFRLQPSFPGEPNAPPDADARWRNVINAVRAHFKGPIAFDLLMGQSVWPNPPQFLDAVDVIRLFWWAPLSGGPAPSVSELALNAGGLLDAHSLPLQQRFQRGVLIVAAYYSADGANTQCLKRDDGQCHSFEDFDPSRPDTTRYPMDLQEQADVYNGLLTAVNTRAYLAGFFTFGYNPVAALRDKSLSVRGKPAEAVLAAWYPKLQGK
jgi:hypothetical protein